jgi:hypothetical protein
MADINLGTLLAKLKLDTSEIQRAGRTVKDGVGRIRDDFTRAGTAAGKGFDQGITGGLSNATRRIQQQGGGLTASGSAIGKEAGTATGKGFDKGFSSGLGHSSDELRQRGGQLVDSGSGVGKKAGTATGKGFTSALGGALTALGGAFVARRIFSFFEDSLKALGELQRVGAQTTAVIRSTGGAARVTATHVGTLAQHIEDLTTVDNKAVQAAANLLLTFTNIRNEVGRGNNIFDQAVETVTDMSVALGTDATQSAIQLGKALNDPIQGINALRRVGVSFTDEQREQIKVLVQTGRTLEAQKIILAELSREFGGSAKALGDTAEGQAARLADAFEEMQVKVGKAIQPVLAALTEVATIVSAVPGPVIAAGAALAGLIAVSLGIRAASGAIRAGLLDPLEEVTGKAGLAKKALGAIGRATVFITVFTAAGAGVDFLNERLDKLFRGNPNLARTTKALVALAQGTGDLDKALAAARIKGTLFDSDRLASLRDKLESTGGVFGALRNQLGWVPGVTTEMEAFANQVDDLDKSLAGLVEGGAPDTAKAAFDKINEALGRLNPKQKAAFFDDYTKALRDNAGAATVQAAASREQAGASKDAAGAVAGLTDDEIDQLDPLGELTSEQLKLAKAYKDTTDELDTFQTLLKQTLGIFEGTKEATRDYEEALDNLAASIKTNGKSFDVNTEKGRNNSKAVQDLVDSVEALTEAQIRQTPAVETAAEANKRLIDNLNDARRNVTPGARRELDGYIRSLGGVPGAASPADRKLKDLDTTLKSIGINSHIRTRIEHAFRDDPHLSIKELDALLKDLGVRKNLRTKIAAAVTASVRARVTRIDVPITVQQQFANQLARNIAAEGHTGGFITQTGIRRFHTGGRVIGRNEVPILAHAGEFVLRKSAVDALGLPFLKVLNRLRNHSQIASVQLPHRLLFSLPKFETGGMVSAPRSTQIVEGATKNITNNFTIITRKEPAENAIQQQLRNLVYLGVL